MNEPALCSSIDGLIPASCRTSGWTQKQRVCDPCRVTSHSLRHTCQRSNLKAPSFTKSRFFKVLLQQHVSCKNPGVCVSEWADDVTLRSHEVTVFQLMVRNTLSSYETRLFVCFCPVWSTVKWLNFDACSRIKDASDLQKLKRLFRFQEVKQMCDLWPHRK